jgi:glycosyltransferase involved in cell wall biosynthesis
MNAKKQGNKTVCMPVYSYYPFDPRVRRAAKSLIENGYSVDVICLRGESEKKSENIDGINVHRLPLVHIRGGYFRYLYNYIMFFLLSFFMLNSLDRKRHYDVVHVHSLPDFLVFIALVQKWKGRKIILDLHEAMPEIFAARFKKDMDSRIVNIPLFLETSSISFASRIITVNDAIKKIYMNRGGVPQKKIVVIMNSPDKMQRTRKDISEFKTKLDLENKFVVVYVGGINQERNIEVIIKAIAKAKPKIPNIYFILFGHTLGQKGEGYKNRLKTLTLKLGLKENVFIGGRLPPQDVSSYLDLADFGVVSYVSNPLTEVAVPNKVFEYIALDKPVISVHLRALHSLFGDEALLYYEPESANDLAAKMIKLYENKNELDEMKNNAKEVYERCKWDVMRKRLQKMYNELIT